MAWNQPALHQFRLARVQRAVCATGIAVTVALGALVLLAATPASSALATTGSGTAAPSGVISWLAENKVEQGLPQPTVTGQATSTSGFVLPPYLVAGNEIPVYPPQGALWRRNGVLAIYKVTTPLQGSQPGPMRWAVLAWQQLLAEAGYLDVPRHGRYDQATADVVRQWQTDHGWPATGELTMAHARALLAPTIRREAAAAGIPAPILCGHLTAESVLDPAAVGANGVDLGIAQISVPYNTDLTEEQFFNVDSAIRYMAQRDARAFRRFGNWNIAVVSYNSPVRAQQWADTGQPSALAARYAARVQLGCGPLDKQVSVAEGELMLRDVALHYLGDPERDWRLAQINNLPRFGHLRPGQLITLPKP